MDLCEADQSWAAFNMTITATPPNKTRPPDVIFWEYARSGLPLKWPGKSRKHFLPWKLLNCLSVRSKTKAIIAPIHNASIDSTEVATLPSFSKYYRVGIGFRVSR